MSCTVPNWAAIDQAIEVLNRALRADPAAVYGLMETRRPCNSELAEDPTVQVIGVGEAHSVGPLGLINGLFGIGPSGWGFVTADYSDDLMQILRFRRTSNQQLGYTEVAA